VRPHAEALLEVAVGCRFEPASRSLNQHPRGGGGSRTRVFRVLAGASPSAAGDWSRAAAVHRRPAATPARV